MRAASRLPLLSLSYSSCLLFRYGKLIAGNCHKAVHCMKTSTISIASIALLEGHTAVKALHAALGILMRSFVMTLVAIGFGLYFIKVTVKIQL